MPFGSVPFSRDGIAAIKNAIRDQYPEIKSSHADEAIAYGLGFKTYAALLPVVERAEASSCMLVQLVPQWVMARLLELGYDRAATKALQGVLWNPPVKPTAEMQARFRGTESWFAPTPANDG